MISSFDTLCSTDSPVFFIYLLRYIYPRALSALFPQFSSLPSDSPHNPLTTFFYNTLISTMSQLPWEISLSSPSTPSQRSGDSDYAHVSPTRPCPRMKSALKKEITTVTFVLTDYVDGKREGTLDVVPL